jgi:hypothetical protein
MRLNRATTGRTLTERERSAGSTTLPITTWIAVMLAKTASGMVQPSYCKNPIIVGGPIERIAPIVGTTVRMKAIAPHRIAKSTPSRLSAAQVNTPFMAQVMAVQTVYDLIEAPIERAVPKGSRAFG